MATHVPEFSVTPSRRNPTTFSSDMDQWLSELNARIAACNTQADEVNAYADTAAASATEAAASATEAAAAAAAALAVVDATEWVSGTTYAAGDCVWSPITHFTYRRRTNGDGTIDPSMDPTNWAQLTQIGISQVVSANSNTTLPSTPTLLKITPATYGVTVTLPDATTMTEGGPAHIVSNKGQYPVVLKNNAGGIIGFIPAFTTSNISLIDNSTAAGKWCADNTSIVGIVFRLTTNYTGLRVYDLGDEREMWICGTATYDIYAVVYDKTDNTIGTPTLVRSAAYYCTAVECGSDKVLVASCPMSSTALQVVVLTANGDKSITVGTPASASLSANITEFVRFLQVGTSWILLYGVNTPEAQIREITVSGTTPTISNAVTLDGSSGAAIVAGSSSVVIAVSYTSSGNLYTKPYSINGLSAGTGTSTADTVTGLYRMLALDTGRWAVIYKGSAGIIGGIITLSGTTTTISTATVLAGATGLSDAVKCGSSGDKVLVTSDATSNNVNLLRDNAGTAVVGTAIITIIGSTILPCVDGNNVLCFSYSSSGINYDLNFWWIDCSGASPVKAEFLFYGKDIYVPFSARSMYGNTSHLVNGNLTVSLSGFTTKSYLATPYKIIQYATETPDGTTVYPGVSSSEGYAFAYGVLRKIALATAALE